MAMSRMSKSRFEMRMFLSILEIHSDRFEGLLERSLRFLGVKSKMWPIAVLLSGLPDCGDCINLYIRRSLMVPNHVADRLRNIVFPSAVDARIHIA